MLQPASVRDRMRREVRFVSLLAILILPLAGLYACHRLHQTPFMSVPDRFTACDRIYTNARASVSNSQIREDQDRELASIWTWQGHRSVLGQHATVGGARCGTVVYLKTGTSFQTFTLSGGP